jgi:hypothetical protein
MSGKRKAACVISFTYTVHTPSNAMLFFNFNLVSLNLTTSIASVHAKQQSIFCSYNFLFVDSYFSVATVLTEIS